MRYKTIGEHSITYWYQAPAPLMAQSKPIQAMKQLWDFPQEQLGNIQEHQPCLMHNQSTSQQQL